MGEGHLRNQINDRYRRKVEVHKEPRVLHHGDCYFWTRKICTCGLLHDLLILDDAGEVYDGFVTDLTLQAMALGDDYAGSGEQDGAL